MAIWSGWKSPEDAIAWACDQLPSHCPKWLQQQFEQLQPDEQGRKAKRWVEWVENIKVNEFAGDPKPRRPPPDVQQIEASYTWGLAYKIGGKR